MQSTAWLLVVASVLGIASTYAARLLQRVGARWQRPMGILAGSLAGVALALPLAAVLNPFVGMQKGSFFNLMALALGLGFLGFIVGSLAGLAAAGMILSPASRIKQDGLVHQLVSRLRRRPGPAPREAREDPSGEKPD